MKSWSLIIAIMLFLTLGSGTAWSPTGSGVENYAIRNPAGSSTVPPSSIQSGLIDSPNPFDTSSNLVITGNVRRGKHFRGTVPYQSATSFRTSLGSTSLESFLRDSAGAEDFGGYTGKYGARPFYSPTKTVTTTSAGRSGVSRPVNTRISSYAPDVFSLEPLPKGKALSSLGTSVSDTRLLGPQTQYSALRQPRSLSLSPQEIEQLAQQKLDTYRRGEKLERTEGIRKQYQNQTEQAVNAINDVWKTELLQRGLKRKSHETTELEQSPAEKDDSLRPFSTGPVSARALSTEGGFVMQSPKEQMKETYDGRSALGAAGYRGDRFSTAGDSALRKGPILWGLQKRDATFGETLQQASKWEGEPKADEAIAEPGKYDTGSLRTLRPLQEQGQDDGVVNAKERVWDRDILERLRQQLDDLAKSVDARLQAVPDEIRETKSTKRADQQPVRTMTDFVGLDSLKAEPIYEPEGAADGEMDASEDEPYFDEMLAGIRTQESSGERSFALDGLNALSQADLPKAGINQSRASLWSTKAKRIMGPHKSFESFSEAKFNQHMQAAESYLRQGRYYRAADSFALASIYKLDGGEAGSAPAQAVDLAMCLAGKGHALFAAGEYISSALFLSRALEIDPEYARTEIDLVTMLGGTDKLRSRIADAKQWLGRSSADELQFLLGYVYYRMDRLQEAKEAIDTAYEKMPDSPAVDAVKRAIDDAIVGR